MLEIYSTGQEAHLLRDDELCGHPLPDVREIKPLNPLAHYVC